MTLASRRLLLAMLLPALYGCGGPPPPPPPAVLTLAIDAGKDQNPEPDGTPAPVAVHVYQLAATAKFERADVFALIEREKATLATDDAASEEFVLSPGEQRTVTRELQKNVQFIGVAVLFRDIDHATWRAIAPVANSGPINLNLSISKLVAKLTQDGKDAGKKPDAKLPDVKAPDLKKLVPPAPSLPSAPSAPSAPSLPSLPKL